MDIDSNAALGAAIQFAAKNLANGDEIVLIIEKHGWGIHLLGGEGNDSFEPECDNVTDDILECVRKSNPEAN